MPNIKFLLLFLIIAGIFLMIPFLLVPKSVIADGFVIKGDPYSDRWDYLDESEQQAFINYEDGIEKIILSIGHRIEETKPNESAVWIFPVPSDPDKVAIDVVTKIPYLSGEEITKKAKLNLLDIKKDLHATQIYTIPFIDWKKMGTGIYGYPGGFFTRGKAQEILTDVTVHEHLENEGLTTEVITAKTAKALYQYFQNKNLKFEEGSIPILDHYIGKKFTFVVSCWISKTNIVTSESQSIHKGVFVTFPSQRIYYPLILTSVYENKVVPITIRIIGYVSPKVFKDIKDYTKIEYFLEHEIADYKVRLGELKNFYNGYDIGEYTKIEINAPPKSFTDDLWMSKGAPLKTYYSSFLAQHPLVIEIFLLILSSIITGIIAGWIVFKELRGRNNILRFILVGLSNCLSILCLLIPTILVKTRREDENVASLMNEIKQKGYLWKRRTAVPLLIASISSLIIVIFGVPFGLPIIFSVNGLIDEGLSYVYTTGYYINYFSIYTYCRPQLITLIVSVAVLVFALIIKKIKKEDQVFFNQLKSFGYSTWSFYPKDKKKLVFVPFFSILFLDISWLVAKLVEFTV